MLRWILGVGAVTLVLVALCVLAAFGLMAGEDGADWDDDAGKGE